MRILLILTFLTSFLNLSSQEKGIIKGIVYDGLTGESLIGANVVYAPGKGTTTDIDGNFELNLNYGVYTIQISYIGYEDYLKEVTLNSDNDQVQLQVYLSIKTLSEVEVVADVAISRKTPVAFSNIPPKLIEEELGSQDLPMILNTTPGVYATQQGGGDGDARVTIRGFNQRNIAVMIDGVPVNDMENGWVYWSNWFGLDAVQRTMQVQRGLGASKIAIPSVGGTINILTKGIDQKRTLRLKQEVGNNGFLRTSVGYNSGQLKGGWGITAAGSYKQGDGWVNGLFTEGYFYYLKAQKRINNHLLSISAMGAPQEHGQRTYKESIRVYDEPMAKANDVSQYLVVGNDSTLIPTYGLDYNQHVGFLERYDLDNDTNRINIRRELLNERQNHYHKPQFTLKDFWSLNDKWAISNIAYLSIGNGGGVRLDQNPDFNADGSVDFQSIYDANTGFSFEPTPFILDDPTINPFIHPTEHTATNFLKSSINNHFWLGLLSTFSYHQNDQVQWSGGIDLRRYKGEHYREVHDLLGADYFTHTENPNSSSAVRREGDIIDYYNDSWVQWGGAFGQLEYAKNNWSTFLNLAGAITQYKRKDYFLPKILNIGDTVLTPGYTFDNGVASPDTISYQGSEYTPESEGLDYQETDWITKEGFTIKTGANYNFTEKINGFMNLGYFSRAPRFQNVFDFSNKTFIEIKNEEISSLELGVSYSDKRKASNLNVYYTYWENRPAPGGISIPDPENEDEFLSANINGMNARHLGVEWDFLFSITKDLEWQGVVSYGDWIWDSTDTVFFSYDNGDPVLDLETGERESRYFDAKGVHVGDAAQSQLSTSLKYEFKKGMYLKVRYTLFDRHFSDFNPVDLDGDNAGRESWKIPGYDLLEVHGGYGFSWNELDLRLRFSVLNALDQVYISDALNNETRGTYIESSDFNAQSAGVFFGQGRRFNTSLTLTF